MTSREIRETMPEKLLRAVELIEDVQREDHQYVSVIALHRDLGPEIRVDILDSMAVVGDGGGAGAYVVREGRWSEAPAPPSDTSADS